MSSWKKHPMEWAKGKSGHVYVDNLKDAEALELHLDVKKEEVFEIKLSPEHETRTFTKYLVNDLWETYAILNYFNYDRFRRSWGYGQEV